MSESLDLWDDKDKKGVIRALVTWNDFKGLPRAWAEGPVSSMSELRAKARVNLQKYCKKQNFLMMQDPGNYVEHMVCSSEPNIGFELQICPSCVAWTIIPFQAETCEKCE